MAEIDITKLAEYFDVKIEDAVRVIKFEMFNEAVRRSIVDTGRFRGNWQITTGQPASGEIDITGTEDELAAAQSIKIWDHLEDNPYATKTWLSNNLPYAGVLDERDGIVDAVIHHGKSIGRRVGANR